MSRLRAASLAAASVAVSACVIPIRSSTPAVPPPPGPLPAPQTVDPAPWLVESLDLEAAFVPPPRQPPVDEILSSTAGLEPALRERVDWWTGYWSGEAASWFVAYLERMPGLVQPVDRAISERGLPASLRFLPIVESGYSPGAVSGARAVGLWQLMSPTAHDFGLEVGPLLDERRDPVRSTEVALDYLVGLRNRFGSWYLALAAYNAGPNRLQRILRRHAPLASPGDSLYWRLRPDLPPETREFIPKFLAAVAVANDPAAFGLPEPGEAARSQGFAFDQVWVPDATTLDVVAQASGATEEEIQRLNPQIVRGITPPGRRVPIRVPEGSRDRFDERYPLIPPGDRVTFVEHSVQAGETLSHIAQRYRLPLVELRAANPDVRDRYLQIGQRLTVPIAPSAARVASTPH